MTMLKAVCLTCTILLPARPAAAGDGPAASLNRLFQAHSVTEALLHARVIPPLKDLAGAEMSPNLKPYAPKCAGPAADHPPRYESDYRIPAAEREKLREMLGVARRYSDFGQALKDGYLIIPEYETGRGIPFVRPDLLGDGKADPERPDMLLYIKKRGAQAYRLAALAYLAGRSKPPDAFRIGRTGSRKIVGQWRPWKDLCFRAVDGQVSYLDGKAASAGCPQGKGIHIKMAWTMTVWLPLYNPKGMFTPRNPLVEYLDLSERPAPFCY